MHMLLVRFFTSLIEKAAERGLTLVDWTRCGVLEVNGREGAVVAWREGDQIRSLYLDMGDVNVVHVENDSGEIRGFHRVEQLDDFEEWLWKPLTTVNDQPLT